MNTIIIYSGKYGTTAECAEILRGKLTGDITLLDMKKKPEQIELSEYDTIIIGSSIYIGAVSKEIRKLCNDNIELLDNKKVGIFLCCGFAEKMDEYLSSNFPASLRESAKSVKVFGGEARLEKMGFIDKMIMKAAMKGNDRKLGILPENIEAFVTEMNGEDFCSHTLI